MVQMPAPTHKQDLLDKDMDEIPTSWLGRAIAGKSAATTLVEVGKTLVGAEYDGGITGLCRHCRYIRNKYSDSQYPDVFCSEHCEHEFIASALASVTVEDCIRIHALLQSLLMGGEERVL
jgi:hypothetical protein